MEKIKIINIGGTFNKQYNPLNGELEVTQNNHIIESILHETYLTNEKPKVKGILFKDSLELTNKDRKKIVECIYNSKEDKIVIVHGTDTMHKTAKYVAKKIQNKQIVFTGAMVPYSISSIEATGNLMLALGFLQNKGGKGVYFAMHGNVLKHDKMFKNREKGVFECL
ncbi:MAG TPA: asparaginase [Arcobacter sp.]|nr:asparaginase [Arcobacter sp.]